MMSMNVNLNSYLVIAPPPAARAPDRLTSNMDKYIKLGGMTWAETVVMGDR